MDDFLEFGGWFDQLFRTKSDGRYVTFKTALNLIYQTNLPPIIVETGTIRQVEDYGAGYSTVIFGEYIARYGGHITTIDIEPKNMEVCRQVTQKYKGSINYIVDDSLHALTLLKAPIDLLYLDSLDTPIGENEDATPAQEHNLKEFKIVEHLLHLKSVVLIDDNNFVNGGKSRLTKKYLKEKGWRVLINGQQTLWIHG